MKVLKRILKWIGISAGILFPLIVLLALFTQTGFFKDRLRVILASSISTRLNGTLHLGTIGGNFLTGFSIDSLAIYSDEGAFLTTGKISCQYELLPALQKKLKVKYLIIEQPEINFERSSNGIWNLNKLLKPQEDTTAGKLDWTLIFDDIELKNGTITLTDSISLFTPDHWNMPASYFEYHCFSINDINIKLSVTIKDNDIRTQINHISCYTPKSQFELSHFKGDLAFNEKGASAKNVVIQTGKSYIEFDAWMKCLNIFKGITLPNMQHDSTQLRFKAKNLDLVELKSFLPQIAFLDGSASIDLDAKGEFGNLTINHLNVKTFESAINAKGNISNLHRPEEMFLDVTISDSKLIPADASKLLTGLHLPQFGNAGINNFRAEFVGKPINFKTKASLKGAVQSIEVEGILNLEPQAPLYNFTFITKSFDVGELFNNKLKSSFTARGTIAGTGFTFKDLESKLEVTIDSSFFQNIALDNSKISVNSSPHLINADMAIASGKMKALVQGYAEFSDSTIRTMDGTIDLTSFNLATLLNDQKYESDLNVQGKISSLGYGINNLNGNLDLTLFPSTFRGHDLNPGTITLKLDQKNRDAKHLDIQSPLADFSLTGKFELDHMISTFSHQTDNLIETIKKHALPESSVTTSMTTKSIIQHRASPNKNMDFNYTLHVKDLDPIASVIGGSPFNAQAELKGLVKGNEHFISLSADGKIDEFYVGTTKGGIFLKNGAVSIDIDSLYDVNTLEQLRSKCMISIDSGLLNTNKISNMQLNLQYKQMQSSFNSHFRFDSLYDFKFIGNISVQPHTYAFDFDSLIASSDNNIWTNYQDVQLRLNYDGLRVMHCMMRRNTESFAATGILHRSGEFDVDSKVKNFDLARLGIWFRNPQLRQSFQGFSGNANIDLKLTGSISSPAFELSARLQDIYYHQTHIGWVDASINYTNENANIDVTVKTNLNDINPSLILKGALPINISFSDVKERFPNREQHLVLKSDGFNLAVLNPVLRDFDNLTGILRCNVSVAGTPRQPQYSGTFGLENTRFILVPNNISYIVNGVFEPHSDSIYVRQFSIKNTTEKKINGEANFTGSLSIKDFSIASFDLLANGQLLLMSDASRKTIPNMYGILFTEISPEGLRLQGTLDRPYLSGKLYIREANLTFPPAKALETANSNLTLPYKIIDDTTKAVVSEAHISKFFTSSDTTYTAESSVGQRWESPLLERLRYNLSIETGGPTALTMIFTPATGEELYAELDGKVTAVNDQGIPNIYGSIEISPRSYYNYYKRFDASGKLKFVGRWDNPELDIQASYEGYRQIVQESSIDTKVLTSQQPTEQKVIVELKISGTRFEPKLNMSLKIQRKPGEQPVDWSSESKGGDEQSDAISFIMKGKFTNQLTSKEQQDIIDLGSSIGSSVASSMLSSIFSDVLRREFPFIRRAEVSYYGGSFQGGTSVNVSATAFKGYLRVGGRILNDIGNANVSYQLSLGDFLSYAKIRNLFFEIQRKVEGDNPEDKKLTNEARIFYRFSF